MNRRNFIHLTGMSTLTLSGARLNAFTADHVIVAGAGIIGASIAYHLAKRGARVTLLEKEHPAAGTTKNSFAWLNAYGKNPRSYYNLNVAGIAGWRRLEIEIGPSLSLQWGGGVQWCKRDDKLSEAMKKHVHERQTWGYPIRLVDQSELTRLLPFAESGEFGAANFADQEGTVDPVVAAKALVAKAQSFGAKLIYPCEVTGVKTSNGRVKAVQTSQGVIECDSFILATGNGTMDLAAKAGMNVPLKESKGILAHTVSRSRLIDRVVMPPGCNIKQNVDGRVVTGTNFEDTGSLEATLEVGQQYLATAASYVPQLKTARIEYMTLGYRVMPKDGLPIVGRSANFPNLYVAAMHSGMTLAPAIGELVSLEVLEQASVDLLDPFRPARFA
jgi:glycine/D-amino acid oxidase-like deaminating enzyme